MHLSDERERDEIEHVLEGELIRVDFSREVDRLRGAQPKALRPTADEERRRAEREAAMTPEAVRTKRRRGNLVRAGVEPPEDTGSSFAFLWTPRRAWERITAAERWEDAAWPGPEGDASRSAMKELAAWLRTNGTPTAALIGNVGTGKTVCAWWALAQTGGLFLRMGDVGRNARWDELRARALVDRGVVVLNDVEPDDGDVRMKDALRSFAEIAQARHEEGRRTLLTSNQPRRDCEVKGRKYIGLESMLGARFVDRLDREGLVVPMRGPSLRGLKE